MTVERWNTGSVVQKPFRPGFLILWITLFTIVASCESDHIDKHWSEEENLTICQFLEINKQEYSKFYNILSEGKMLSALCAYNPYGEDYTLFLPTNEAVDKFIAQSEDFENLEEMLQDTSFIKTLSRYHTVGKKLHSDNFPDGALEDTTLTGDRLTFGFYQDDDKQLIKVNNEAPIVRTNLNMTNGYIHVVSGILEKPNISGYDWLQQKEEFSILAEAIERSGVKRKLWWSKYTILAEHDSIFHRDGIQNLDDLISHVAPPGSSNSLYQFAASHIVGGELYLNDLAWGSKKYWTKGSKPVVIDVGIEIRINPGVDTFGIEISESGDTTIIDYIRLLREGCNIMTKTGPVHSISDLLIFEPLP